MVTMNNHAVLLKQLAFMQSLFPFELHMNYKRTGSFELCETFLTRYRNIAVPVSYEIKFNSAKPRVEIIIASKHKTMFRASARSFDELEGTIREIIKPLNNKNPHITQMSYESQLLIRCYVKNRPTIGFVYRSSIDKEKHHFVDKHGNGDVDTYYFRYHTFPLLLDTWDGQKCFENEQALATHLLKK